MSSPTASAVLLKEGIQAARSGQTDHARKLLLQVVEQDERNEIAWLWLSGVVETAEDRLVCLENVLALNPENASAKKGLARLQKAEEVRKAEPVSAPEPLATDTAESADNIVRVERPPISPAAAVLYPERQIMELPWDERTDLETIPAITYESHTKYSDIWEKESDICAFCAYELDYDDTQCPQCKRKLYVSQFQYPKHSADLIVYFVLLIGTAQLFFVHALVDLIVQAPLLTVVWDIFLFLVLFVLSGAIALRQFWAYTTSIVVMILIFLSMVFNVATSVGESGQTFLPADSVAYFQALAESPFITLIAPVLEFLVPFQMLAIFLALIYGIFRAGPDFVRERLRLVATVDKGLNDSSAFYEAGKAYAKKEMWASAVLHFQRAAAHEPNRAFYHLAVGKAYAQLNFKQRAMDAYTSARRLASNDELKKEIELAIANI